MAESLVLTVIGPDKPGLVESLAELIASHDGNWLESRMSHLAGQFAGLLRVSVPEDKSDSLISSLQSLETTGLSVVVQRSFEVESSEGSRCLRLELVGTDRKGIVRDISRALAERGVNVEELNTEYTAAPMSGDMMFKATAELRAPSGLSLDELRECLEALAHDLMVDLTLGTTEK